MKHGRRHDTLKEKAYLDRAHGRAEGYARPYAPIDVATPTTPPPPPPDTSVELEGALKGRSKHELRRALTKKGARRAGDADDAE